MPLPGVKTVIKDIMCCGPGPHLECGHTNPTYRTKEQIIEHHEKDSEFYRKRAQELTEEIADVLERIEKCHEYARLHDKALLELDPGRKPNGPVKTRVVLKDGCVLWVNRQPPPEPTPYPEGFSINLHGKREMEPFKTFPDYMYPKKDEQ